MIKSLKRILTVGFAALAIWQAGATGAAAQRAPLRMIRDAEIERILKMYANPVLAQAGMDGSVQIHIVNNDQINAFVAGGRHMFIHTGLLIHAETAAEVIAVIAHETGHIVGAHLISLRNAIREAQIKQIITFLLSAAAGVAARDGRVAVGGVSLGNSLVQGTFFQYTRSQEQAADQFALSTLDRLRMSARGLKSLLERLMDQEALMVSQQDPYLRTHPLTRSRLQHVEEHLRKSPYANAPMPERFRRMHARMRAKLIGFLMSPEQVHEKYASNPNSMEARYAKAVAYHRENRVEPALAAIDSLIKQSPRDGYFHELKGQILFESGRTQEAVTALEAAVRFAPNEPLIHVALAQAQLQTNNPRLVGAALRHLQFAVRTEKNYPDAWRFLGVAYGRQKQMGRSSLALAEYYLLVGPRSALARSVARAEKLLPRGSPAWRRAQDIKIMMQNQKRRRR